MNNGFPKVNRSFFTGEAGVNLVSNIVNNEFGWIFRPNHGETDFGIDAYIDVVSENNFFTGQSIALQIKSGKSFFKQKTSNGFMFYGEIKHFNYYANSQVPVFIIICDMGKRVCFWQKFDIRRIEKTQVGWKINIPSSNVFSIYNKDNILNGLPSVKDYSSELERSCDFNNLLKSHNYILYTIGKSDILSKNISNIRDFFDRVQFNDCLFETLQGKVWLSIEGYDHEKRELFEIDEIRWWFKKANKELKPWFFLLTTENPYAGVGLYFSCVCDAKVVSGRKMNAYETLSYIKRTGIKDMASFPKLSISFDIDLFSDFVGLNFPRLNEITEHLCFPIEKNKEISYQIFKSMGLPDQLLRSLHPHP